MYGMGKFWLLESVFSRLTQTDAGRALQSTQPFELYLTVSPSMPKMAVVSVANAVARWINKEEARLFLRDAPVF